MIIAILGIALGWYMFVYPRNDVGSNVATETLDMQNKETANPITPGDYKSKETTGDVQGIVTEINAQLQTEQNNFIAEDSEASASLIDQSSLDDFGQSYDENEF